MKKLFWAHPSSEVNEGARIGLGTKIWQNCQVQKGAVIGNDCVIGHNCFIAGEVKMGNGVKLESNIDVWSLVCLEDYVFVGPSAVFTNDMNPRAKYPKSRYPQHGKWVPTVVKEGASIGANATIICGNVIGRWAFVGAGAVVTKDVPDYTLVAGVPARAIGWICECGARLDFQQGKAYCGVCERNFQKKEERVSQI